MDRPLSIHAEVMVDPRGELKRQPTRLAQRLPGLKGKSVLLFDNTQMTTLLANFGPIFQWLGGYLEQDCDVACSFVTRDLLKASKSDIAALADELCAGNPDAIILALCRGGITGPTSLLAAELEQRGKPCVQICTQIGYPLAGVIASTYVPGLPIALIQPATGGEDVFGQQQALAIAPQIVKGLTGSPDDLISAFQKQFPSSTLHLADKGEIRLPAMTVMAGEKAEIDPSYFDLQLYEKLCAADMCDGFPVIAPTRLRVGEMLAFSPLNGGEVLLNDFPPSGAAVTVRSLAANAVMAGCRPAYFPVVLAAFQAIADPAYRIVQGAITSHPGGNAIVVSGPMAQALGIASGAGCLGPGFRANATIGRAITLTILNVARAIPGKSDLSVFGSPAEYTYCFAESPDNPWAARHAELYDQQTTSVTVHRCEAPHNVLDPRDGPEALLRTIAGTAATPGGNNMVHLGELLVLLNPGQAQTLAKAGWSKRDVQEFLFETARHPAERAKRQGKRASFPPYFLDMEQVPVMRSPDDVIIIVCGGNGNHAMVGVPWGRARAVNRPVFQVVHR